MTIMKVLLLNGSPRKEGCTYTALTEIAETLKKNGVEAEIFQAGDPSQENVAAAAAIMKEADALLLVLRFTGLLLPDRSSNSWINSLPRPEGYDPQACRSCCFRKTCRYYCYSGCSDQILYLSSDACRVRKLLDNGSRQYPG